MAWSEVTSMQICPSGSAALTGTYAGNVCVERRQGPPFLFGLDCGGREIFDAYEAWVMNGKSVEEEKADSAPRLLRLQMGLQELAVPLQVLLEGEVVTVRFEDYGPLRVML